MLVRQTNVQLQRRKIASRREFLRMIPAASIAAGTLSWSDWLAAESSQLRKQGKACILLWMQGGPSQFETFSPLVGHAHGGETKAIKTSVPGIQIAHTLPNLAQVMDELCVIRSMTSKEGSHPRATYLMHTGYLPNPTVEHPSLGAHVAHQIGEAAAELPSFVRIGRARNGADGGLLGVDFDPYVLRDARQPPANISPNTSEARFQDRLALLKSMDRQFDRRGAEQEAQDHQKLYNSATKMMLSQDISAFDVSQEPAAIQAAYGNSAFGKGCLLARRLIEHGVTFVEVTLNGWDTHQDNFTKVGKLCGQLDQPYAQLIRDLKQRGMLDDTLVVWMGEFGRTPRINPRAGRDHFPKAFNVALAGGGVKGGQVIGSVNATGSAVKDRPVTVPDLFRTICTTLHIDADHENMSPIGRPMSIVDGGEVVSEVLG
jgi:uncharacterized protein (DUF1501 family)